jgi:hypothetical protein
MERHHDSKLVEPGRLTASVVLPTGVRRDWPGYRSEMIQIELDNWAMTLHPAKGARIESPGEIPFWWLK